MIFQGVSINQITDREALVVASLDGQILAGNKEALELYRYPSLQSFKKLNLRDLMPNDFNQFYPELMTAEHLNISSYKTHVNRRSDGELFACKLHTHHQTIKGQKYLVGHVVEIREEVDIEKICLQQNIIVLQRELEAERSKNREISLRETSLLLAKAYPSLSNNDIKVCHYLLKNYSSKAIAKELNITTEGVFAARKRIRKKLGLQPGEELNKALLQSI
ncbi:PAS domain S-box protein [Carboxylicivirga sediminis]|uniref:PAS domain S-box protein n=1 Tax=Carboxylicivirga sediminis TaxID=2006564 RepID=A0A941F425_9BACT|nr:PAS domain S-box protein [Carboxylicivirga sediminis]MBR8536411.1 PAS domain S-box protein [Carboxylicivirga sediminis]